MPKQHQSTNVKKFFKELQENGFTITRRKNGFVITNKDGIKYFTHGTESSFHPLRRFFKKLQPI